MRILVFVLLTAAAVSAQEGPPPGRPPLRERAAKGDVEAQYRLAMNYEAGRSGLKKDYAQAAHWYRMAAEQGDPYAQAGLGLLYRFGKGVDRDLVQAYLWLDLAVNHTTGPESDSIKEYRDAAGAKMSQQQIADAVKLEREWKPKPSEQK